MEHQCREAGHSVAFDPTKDEVLGPHDSNSGPELSSRIIDSSLVVQMQLGDVLADRPLVHVRVGHVSEGSAVLGVETGSVKNERKSYIPKKGGYPGYSMQLRFLKVFDYFFP